MMRNVNVNEQQNQQSYQTCDSVSIFNGVCGKNIHWYVGYYSNGQWIYNECVYCKKRQIV